PLGHHSLDNFGVNNTSTNTVGNPALLPCCEVHLGQTDHDVKGANLGRIFKACGQRRTTSSTERHAACSLDLCSLKCTEVRDQLAVRVHFVVCRPTCFAF